MDQLIPVLNSLSDVLVSVGLDTRITLPQIAVVGAQSVGKSSVLESLVGRDFLPRGVGIVTRRPLILQLRNIQTKEEWGEFMHRPGDKIYDFAEIRREIEVETDRIAGHNKSISSNPITLKIFSPYVIDLTLIDLPGLTKVPVGDQPTDIEEQIRSMIKSFICYPHCIILAVSAANSDLANSDSLNMARQVDPLGQRTVGVLTKVDLMDEGTDAMDILTGRTYPLKLGHIALVCRGFGASQQGKDVRSGLKKEEVFFRSHPVYGPALSRGGGIMCGTACLAALLNKILVATIRDALPDLKARISRVLYETQTRLQRLGEPLAANTHPSHTGAMLLNYFSKFARNFQDAIDGKMNNVNEASEGSWQLTGGARLHFVFHDWFGLYMERFDPLQGLTDHEIRVALRNATGPSASLFVPEGAFEILVRRQLQKMQQPCLQCVEQVHEELTRLIAACEVAELSRHEVLRERMLQVVRGALNEYLGPALQMVTDLINIELAYINTNHPDFVGGSRSIVQTLGQPPPQTRQQHASSSNPKGLSPIPSGPPSTSPNSLQNSRVNSPPTHPYPPQYLDTNGGEGESFSDVTSLNHNSNSVHAGMRAGRHMGGPSSPTESTAEQSSISTGTTGPNTSASTASNSQGGILSFFISRNPSRQAHTPQPSTPISLAPPVQPTAASSASRPPAGPARATSATDLQRKQRNPSQPQTVARHQSPGAIVGRGGGLVRWGALQEKEVHWNAQAYITLPPVPAVLAPAAVMTDRERIEIELIKKLIVSYINVVRKNLMDLVPKTVMHFLVNAAKEGMQKQLIAKLYSEELFPELLKESDAIVEERQRCQKVISTLNKASDILDQLRGVHLGNGCSPSCSPRRQQPSGDPTQRHDSHGMLGLARPAGGGDSGMTLASGGNGNVLSGASSLASVQTALASIDS